MKTIPKFIALLLVLIAAIAEAQQVSINYKPNPTSDPSKNPFAKFIGEWTLKNDDWNQNWGGGKEAIKIPNHHTVCTSINTDLSLMSIIDGPQPNGHIFWSFDPKSQTFNHLSSFGTARSGVGGGTINKNGDLAIKVAFSDEAPGTYRLYSYKWISNNEYELMSIQYDEKDKATGLFYGGTFVRVK